jgi:hypothetical protein
VEGDPEIEKLIRELNRLLPSAKVHPFKLLFPEARQHQCHTNADRFVAGNQRYRVVRGWLFFDFRAAALMGLEPTIRFTAHSIVQNDSGDRYEITPSQASQCYPFIEHPFGNEDFEKLVDSRKLSHIDVDV